MNKKSKEGIKRKIASFSLTALLLNVAMVGVLAPAGDVLRAEDDQMCEAAVDVVLIMDRSGSMDEGKSPSKCEWPEMKEIPGGGGGVAWFLNTKYDVTEQWCMEVRDELDESYLVFEKIPLLYTPAVPSKINAAKDAANSFLGNLGPDDQSSVVSFSDNASLDKTLSNNHLLSQTTINGLTAGGATNIGDAIAEGTAELGSERANPQAVKAMILLTDGKANMPSGVGDPELYAKNKAAEAAALGYKIFTIGLGNDVNKTMLQDIANITGTEYYYAPTGEQLADIYNSISQQVCQYSFISGYKYNDTNNDGNISGEPIITGWEIILSGDANDTQLTDGDGRYTFAGLEPGTYTISEMIPGGSDWVQTYAPDPNTFTIGWQEYIEGINFGNYLPICGNGIISGCKYNDKNDDGIINTGEEKLSGWEIQLIGCPYLPNGEFLPKENIKINPEPEETGHCVVITTTTTGEDGCYSFTNLEAGNYGVSEVTQENWTQTYPEDNTFYYFNLTAGEPKTDIDFLNYYEGPECTEGETVSCYTGPEGTEGVGICQAGIRTCSANGTWGECEGEVIPQGEICGNGIDEDCNGSDTSCGGGGGGGWTPPTVIKITDEKVAYLGDGKALVSWKTNVTTTNQVVYGDDSIETDNLGDAPEYDYDSVNEESSSMWKEHEVMITGLIDGITYYFRPVADRNGSEEVVGEEVSYIFEEESEVKGVTDPPAPAECNYLLEYIKLGADNNPVEVEKLERFLNEFEGENLPVNGIYEQIDFDAVSRFQEKYLTDVLAPWSHNAATGYVYITTKKKINEIYCQKVFPLTAEQEAEVASFSERFLGMFAGSAEASDSGSEDSTSGDTSESFEAEDEEDISGRVGGAKDEVDESDGEDETMEETENGTEDEDETKEEDEKPEDKTGEGVDTTEDAKDEDKSEVAGIKYSEYLLWLTALVVITGIAWYYWPKKKEGSE